jgi:hypothetical protein
MNITLRKANALQNGINDALKNVNFLTSISINEFQDPESAMASAEETFAKSLERRDSLLVALYEIRKLVGKGNEVAGISERLCDVAFLEKQIQFFTELANKQVKESNAVIQGKLEKIKSRPADSRVSLYGREDDVTTSIFEKDEVEGFRQLALQFKKQKQKLQDEILEMNVRTEVPLSEHTVKTLTKEGLI